MYILAWFMNAINTLALQKTYTVQTQRITHWQIIMIHDERRRCIHRRSTVRILWKLCFYELFPVSHHYFSLFCVLFSCLFKKPNFICSFRSNSIKLWCVCRILSDDSTLVSSARFDTFRIIKTYKISFVCIEFV